MVKAKEQKSKKSKFLTIAVNSILVMLILLGLFVAIPILPIRNNYRILAVMSGSMEPAITTGSLVVIKPVSSYKERDIVTFKTSGSTKKNDYTTHRIVKIETKDNNKVFVTKGDANKSDDTKQILQKDIIGKEFFSIALLGYIIGYIKTLPGLILIILIPAIIIIYEEVKKIHREAKQIIAKKRELRKIARKETDKKNAAAEKVLEKKQKEKKPIKKRRKNVKKT